MPVLYRGGLRVVTRRKWETLAIVMLMALGTGFLAGVAIDVANFQNYMARGLVDTLGHVSFFGVFDEEAVKALERVPGVSRVEAYYWVSGLAVTGESRSPVVLVDEGVLENPLVQVNTIPGPGEALALVTVSAFSGGPPVIAEPGASVTVTVYDASLGEWRNLTLRVSGEARTVVSFSGTVPVLVVDSGTLAGLTGGRPSWIAVWVVEPRDELIDGVAGECGAVLSARGYRIQGVYVNHVEDNPAAKAVESMSMFVQPFLVSAVILVAVLAGAGGAMLVVRSVREAGVLASLGVSRRELAIYYTLPWLARILVGAAAGAILSPLVGKLIFNMTMGKSGFIDIFYEAYGYTAPSTIILEYASIAVAVAAAGAIVPGALAARLEPREALAFYGIRGGAGTGVKVPFLTLRLSLRGIRARPWRLAGLVLAMGLILGSAMGAGMFNHSVEEMVDEYWDSMDYDVLLFVHPSSNLVGMDPQAVESIIRGDPAVVGAQFAACRHGDYVPRAGRTVSVATAWGDTLSFRVVEGREPSGDGEAVVSLSLSKLLGVGPGDVVIVRGHDGALYELTIVGVGVDKCDNYYVWVTPTQYSAVTGTPLSYEGLMVYVKTSRADPAVVAERIAGALNRDPSLLASYELRSDLLERSRRGLSAFTAITYGFSTVSLLAGVGVVASLVLVDLAGRRREIGVLEALGLPLTRILATILYDLLIALAASAPLAVVIGYLFALHSQRVLLEPMGYVPIDASATAMVSWQLAANIASTILVTLLLAWAYTRRLSLVEVLRPD